MGGDAPQGFHRDGQFGIKLQVPLVNVTFKNGPVEIIPKGEGICKHIFGTVEKGTAIIYQQSVTHRGLFLCVFFDINNSGL